MVHQAEARCVVGRDRQQRRDHEGDRKWKVYRHRARTGRDAGRDHDDRRRLKRRYLIEQEEARNAPHQPADRAKSDRHGQPAPRIGMLVAPGELGHHAATDGHQRDDGQPEDDQVARNGAVVEDRRQRGRKGNVDQEGISEVAVEEPQTFDLDGLARLDRVDGRMFAVRCAGNGPGPGAGKTPRLCPVGNRRALGWLFRHVSHSVERCRHPATNSLKVFLSLGFQVLNAG